MSPEQLPAHWKLAHFDIEDPGASGFIDNSVKGFGVCHAKTAAAEGRTLRAPNKVLQFIAVVLSVDGGDLTLTVKDSEGNTTYSHVLNDAGDMVFYMSIKVGTTFKWKVISYSGLGAALTAADAATIDTTYGSQESGVLENVRTRVNEIEAVLEAAGLVKAN